MSFVAWALKRPTGRKLPAAICLFVAAAVQGCAGGVVPVPTPVGQASPSEATYIIGPGDQLSINVWNNPEVSANVPVRPDGKVSSPLVEDMVAVGKTPATLADDIERVLSEYIRAPQVTVIVTGFVGDYSQQVRVIGQAVSPQALPYRDGMRLLDVIIAVGGLQEFAAGNRAQVIRNVNGEESTIRVRMDDLLNKGDMRENLVMRPGDVVLIPESRF